jgi:hypothetical protein
MTMKTFSAGWAMVVVVGVVGWANAGSDDAVQAAREKRTAALHEVAADRTRVKEACAQKTSACEEARTKYKSDLAVYHQDEAAFRSMRTQPPGDTVSRKSTPPHHH